MCFKLETRQFSIQFYKGLILMIINQFIRVKLNLTFNFNFSVLNEFNRPVACSIKIMKCHRLSSLIFVL